MTAFLVAVVVWLFIMLVALAICAISKAADTYTLTDTGEQAAARALRAGTQQVVWDATEQVYVCATLHPCGSLVIERFDEDAMAERLARKVGAE